MCISIKDIDESNWLECINLKVAEKQEDFISTNLYTIAQSKFEKEIKLLGIFKDEVMIGFAAYILDKDGDMNLYKLMMDEQYQGKGYGKEALKLLMELIKIEAIKNEIWLSLHPDNKAAIKLYSDYGFNQEIVGLEAEDEIFFRYVIS
jgi:diamine N-acetyltransferase